MFIVLGHISKKLIKQKVHQNIIGLIAQIAETGVIICFLSKGAS
jgi:hypothetical protein